MSLKSVCMINAERGYSSVVEHSTADREVPGSNPGAPFKHLFLSSPKICHKISNTPSQIILPYPRERGPMGGASYIRPRLGDGPIFEVSVLRLYSKERPGKLPTLAS